MLNSDKGYFGMKVRQEMRFRKLARFFYSERGQMLVVDRGGQECMSRRMNFVKLQKDSKMANVWLVEGR